jgi:uncharacterized protein
MRFEWGESKNRRNVEKHGIRFETATAVFDDPYALSDFDRVVDGEERWQTIGRADGSVILVAHMWWWEDDGKDLIRLVSARRATSAERNLMKLTKSQVK